MEKYHLYTMTITDGKGHRRCKGVVQFIGCEDGFYCFKTSKYFGPKTPSTLTIPTDVIDRFEFREQSYINNGLCDMPEV